MTAKKGGFVVIVLPRFAEVGQSWADRGFRGDVTRATVATLEEARWAAAEALAAANVRLEGEGDPKAFTPSERAEVDEAIGDEAGGTIGPLRDGTIIEVRPA